MAPKEVPKQIATIVESELPPANAGGVGVVGGTGGAGGILGGILGGIPSAAPPPPPPVKKEAKAAVPQRIRVGGNVQSANLISKVTPAYPADAKAARSKTISPTL